MSEATEKEQKKAAPVELSLFDDTTERAFKVDEGVIELFHSKSTFLLHQSPQNPFVFEEIGMTDYLAWVFERRGVEGIDVEPYEEKASHEYKDIWKPQKEAKKKKIDYSGYGVWRYNPVALYRTKNKYGKLVNEHCIILHGETKWRDHLESRIFAILSPITYVGRNRYAKNARYLYAFVIDLDGVGMQQMYDVIHQQRSDLVDKNGETIKAHVPMANIIVNSGNGLHIYFLLERPVALYKDNVPLLRKMKTGLTNLVWNEFTSNLKDIQYQGIYQGFRMPGTLTKFGEKIRAFRNTDAEYHSLKELNGFLSKYKLTKKEIEQLEGKAPYNPEGVTLDEAKRLYPEWYERVIVMGDKKPKKWNIKRDLYDWWLKRLRDEDEKIVPGHRYFCLLTLAVYAMKCNVSKEELARDAYSLLRRMDKITTTEDNHFTTQDIEDALMGYSLWYCTFPRNSIKYLTGLEIKENRRNGRTQAMHLRLARSNRDILCEERKKDWREGNGRPLATAENSKIAAMIKDWREQHPDNLNKSACARELGLTRPTVRKWWKMLDETGSKSGKEEAMSFEEIRKQLMEEMEPVRPLYQMELTADEMMSALTNPDDPNHSAIVYEKSSE